MILENAAGAKAPSRHMLNEDDGCRSRAPGPPETRCRRAFPGWTDAAARPAPTMVATDTGDARDLIAGVHKATRERVSPEARRLAEPPLGGTTTT